MIALDRILMPWTTYHGAGPHINALDRSAYTLATARSCLRRPTYACDGPLMLATAHLCLRRPAHACDAPPTYSSAGPTVKVPVRLS
jgi:hypothetical protein